MAAIDSPTQASSEVDSVPPLVDSDLPLEPIPGDQPAGRAFDLNSFTSPLYQIQHLVDQATSREKERSDWQEGKLEGEPEESANWEAVVEPALEFLRHQAKDLRVVAYLGQAWVRVDGLPGLERGLLLYRELTQRFWDKGLHPAATTETGHATAMADLKRFLGDRTIDALGEQTLFESPTSDTTRGPARTITFRQAKHCKDYEAIADAALREQRAKRFNWCDSQTVAAIADATPTEHLRQTLRHLDACLTLAKQLGEFLGEHCQNDQYDEPTAPTSELRRFREALAAMRRQANAVFKDRKDSDTTEPSEGTETTDAESDDGPIEPGSPHAAAANTRPPSGTTWSRENAFRQIEQVADAFAKHEPHSPVQYGLRQIVRWGRMSFPDLLRELLEDESTLRTLDKRIGFSGPDGAAESDQKPSS